MLVRGHGTRWESARPKDSVSRPRPYRLNASGGTHATVVSLVPPHSRVLDAGCASGYLGSLLVARGCSVVGLERDSSAVAAAQATGAYQRVEVVDLDGETPDLGEPFDVVVAADVLEHLRDPVFALRTLIQRLAPTGLVIVSLPNVAHLSLRLKLLAGRFDYTQTGILDRTHLHLYTFSTARRLVEQAGLVTVGEHVGSDLFGPLQHRFPRMVGRMRGLVAYSIVLACRRRPEGADLADRRPDPGGAPADTTAWLK